MNYTAERHQAAQRAGGRRHARLCFCDWGAIGGRAGENGREGAQCGFKPLEGAPAWRKPCHCPNRELWVLCLRMRLPIVSKGFVLTHILLKDRVGWSAPEITNDPLATLRYITLGGANRPTGDPDVAVLPVLT